MKDVEIDVNKIFDEIPKRRFSLSEEDVIKYQPIKKVRDMSVVERYIVKKKVKDMSIMEKYGRRL